jgi:hypothetical protein
MINNKNTDLTKAGSVNFWVRIAQNPNFTKPETNINFMYEKNMGGVLLTILKEKTSLKIKLKNPKYGFSTIESDISKKLHNDMMVTITWTEKEAKLYINSEFAAQGVLQP